MKRHLYTIENLDDEGLDSFMQMYNSCSEETYIVLYVSSGGGKGSVRDFMLHIINSEPDRFMMIGYWLASYGWILFYNARCKRHILSSESYALLHSGAMDLPYIKEGLVRGERDQFEKAIFDKYNEVVAPHFLTEDEAGRYNQGLDVYLDADRILSIIPECTRLQL